MNNENVEFYLRHTGPCTQCHNGPFKQISSFDDLLKYTRGYPLHMDIPYTLRLKRIADEIVTDEYTILVGDKLIYPNDVATFLIDQYKNTFNFNLSDTEHKPVMLDGVHEQIIVGTRKNGVLMPDQKIRSAQWHYLTNADIFVERETLNQIWPVETGRPPVGLVELLNKKTEKVY